VWTAFEDEEVHSEAVVRKYLSRLREFGLARPRETALHALTSLHMPTVELGARLLESVGEANDAHLLVDMAGSIGDLKVAGFCLEAAARLQQGALPARAIRLLSHPRRSLRPGVESRLARKSDPSHLPELLRLLEFGRDADSRLRAARLIAPFANEEKAQSALKAALRDSSVAVAFQALSHLTGISESAPFEPNLPAVESLLENSAAGLELGYYLFALLAMQRETEQLLIGPEHLPFLRTGMGSGDTFVSGTAAACLAEYEFRGGAHPSSGMDDIEILHRLIRSIAGSSFYPQYSRFARLGERSLIRFSGVDLSKEGRASWLTWFEQNNQDFRGVRSAIALNPSNLSALSFRWATGGKSRMFLGIDAPSTGQKDDEVRWLGPMDLRRLYEALDRAGVFSKDAVPGVHGNSEGDLRFSLELQAGPLRKPMSFYGATQPAWSHSLLLVLDDLFESLEWQKLAPVANAREFILERLPAWDGATELKALQFKLGITRDRMASTDDDLLLEWCEHLSNQSGIGGLWNQELGRACLSEFSTRQHHSELVDFLMWLALHGASSDMLPEFLGAVTELDEPLRSKVLMEGLLELGPEASKTSLMDERLVVRVAGARALGQAGAVGREALLEALKDSNALVVRMAIRSLGELGDQDVVASLLPFAEPSQIRAIRREAIQALGALGDARAFSAVSAAALPEEDAGLRLDAVRALALLPGDEVDQAFIRLLPEYAGGILERDFSIALEKRGISKAILVYSTLLESPEVASKRVAILAGRLGIPKSASVLIDLLPESPRDPEILHALASCTTVDFRNMPDPAGVWAAWWLEHGQEEPFEWLSRTATSYGYSLKAVEDSDEPTTAHIQALIQLLQDGPRHLRAPTAYQLFIMTERNMQPVGWETSDAAISRIVSEWEEWLSSRKG
jgi:hypothetical protein